MPVRAKKAKTPRRSLRYLLYADRALQRISLRRVSVRTKKTKTPTRTVRAKKTAARQPSPSRKAAEAVPVEQATGSFSLRRSDPWWMAFAAVCVAGIVVLIGIPSSSQRAGRPSARIEDTPEPQDDAAPVSLETLKPVSKAALTTSVARTPKASAPAPPSAVAKPWITSRPAEPTRTSRTAEPTTAPAIEPAAGTNPTANAAAQNTTPVTIQGCLQAGNEGFWLKDVSGADAPTSRSWKSGFLKKRSAAVEVVDAPDSLRLANYLGQRVAASGPLTDRRLQVRSLHRVAGSCN
jgi:hypothetical protein